MNTPKPGLLDRVADAILGPDEEDDLDEAHAQDDEVAEAGAIPIRRPHYTVEVTYDEETRLFGARVKTRTAEMELEDPEGSTPGEVLAYVGMLIDASLVRRGFGREKKG